MKLTERDIETLKDLASAEKGYTSRGNGWCAPLDIGGSDGSHHSYTLKKLVDRGAVERRKVGWVDGKGSCMYRTTAAGREFLAQLAQKEPGDE